MGIEFGKDARKQIVRGQFVASFQYVNEEPALILWRLNAIGSALALKRDAAVVICLSSAYKYADDDYLVERAAHFTKIMGCDHSRGTVFKLATFISDMLIELVTMKPLPAELEAKRPDMDVTIRDDGIQIVMDEQRLH